eukprot:TRINITY_DN47394_c0_g1_i1.p1 TRINITY_DN47394_c0_g1~~TRINITY_DN47394_c0_g1_i1.p1  ORF type:complete len:475 (+),score=148.75 TRINITY_DN47394_c0_g1_i1:58-1425(+)
MARSLAVLCGLACLVGMGTAARAPRLVFVHHKALNPLMECESRTLGLMRSGLAKGFEVVFVSIPPLNTKESLPCGTETHKVVRRWKRKRNGERPWNFGVTLKKGQPGLPMGVKSVDLTAQTECQGLETFFNVATHLPAQAIIANTMCGAPGFAGAVLSAMKVVYRFSGLTMPPAMLTALSDVPHKKYLGYYRDAGTCNKIGKWVQAKQQLVAMSEMRAYRNADAVVFAAPQVADESAPGTKLVVPYLAGRFHPDLVAQPQPPGPAWKDRWGMAFIGGGDYVAVQGMNWFINDVYPRLRNKGVGGLTLLSGDLKSSGVCKATGCACGWADGKRINVVKVNNTAEIFKALQQVRVVVAPSQAPTADSTAIRYGLAAGIPIFTTSEAAALLGPAVASTVSMGPPSNSRTFAVKLRALHNDEAKWKEQRAAQWKLARSLWLTPGEGIDVISTAYKSFRS